MTRLLRLLILTLVIGCVALFSGAVAQYGGSQTPAQTADANVTITSPEANASVAVGNVTVEVNVTNFALVEPTGQANAAGEGHLHYYLDAPMPTNESEPAIPETGGYVVSANTSYTWENVTAGEHNLSVQLVNNDHTPLIPLTFETVNITAQDVEFDMDTITVPAGANVTVNFDNMDDGIPHNVAVYTDSSAVEEIFVGEIIDGPAEITYTFTAPEEPGTYYFQCDIRPQEMTGDFIVE